MNIESVNLLSLSPSNSPIESGAVTRPLLGKEAIPENFSKALIGQIGALSEAKGQVELPGQLQSPTASKNIDNSQEDEKELAALFEEYFPPSYEPVGGNEDADLEATLRTLTDTLTAITHDEAPATQDVGSAMALNGLPFVKPLPEGTKLNRPVEDVASGDFLQKETVIRQSIQDGQGFNLQALENLGPAKKALMAENQTALLGTEKAVPGAIADMTPFHRPVDNGTNIPAITKPLAHPGWSRDLGEQIVWMNNKALAAAEINLNPAHLGPLSVRIDVNQDQATIMFTAQHAEVKEALEASIHKLREMLATQQLNLANVNISQNATPDQGRPHSQAFFKAPENHEQGAEDVPGTIEKTEQDRGVVSKGLLSLYA
jgi:flagellar hook-length control protein FliK